ncbi:hypothetical protein HMPREF1250_1150 [Megasphaera vaginalis (ex Srinivasan et al. 2021)]|uniref:Uncharacterized protein n=1 Tax=Megasphaera vaginalis (ex Srinivasan et al. 2021) TaxID=1111454 RepID=U7UEY8_9FIRM|nr:hypothetical protein HMPREF1250_1150 [Megasphaera vaginalis (ex Srinivasan et al. 2021)]
MSTKRKHLPKRLIPCIGLFLYHAPAATWTHLSAPYYFSFCLMYNAAPAISPLTKIKKTNSFYFYLTF